VAFRLRTWSTFEGNLPNAERILVKHGTDGLRKAGDTLRESAREIIRRDTGEAARRIKVLIVGKGLNKLVEVYGELVQHVVDQNGLPPGIFPPWDVGSRIYQYVERKGLHNRIQRSEHHNFGVRRLPRKVSHVKSRRPANVRASIRAKGTEALGSPGSNTANRRASGRGLRPRRVNTRNQTTTRSNRSLSRERAIRRIAFLIARSIFERGIRANQWASKTLETNSVQVIRDLQDAFIEAVAEINRG
jgi:hypothetical protein